MPNLAIPALFTIMSGVLSIFSYNEIIDSSSLTSAAYGFVLLSLLLVFSESVRFKSTAATEKLFSERLLHIENPKPPPAPVTIACFI